MVCANTSMNGDGFWIGLAPVEAAAAAAAVKGGGWFNFEDTGRGFP